MCLYSVLAKCTRATRGWNANIHIVYTQHTHTHHQYPNMNMSLGYTDRHSGGGGGFRHEQADLVLYWVRVFLCAYA